MNILSGGVTVQGTGKAVDERVDLKFVTELRNTCDFLS